MSRAAVSVVIPVYNDPEGVATTVDALLHQETSARYHVNVVDNNSTDRTPAILDTYDDDRLSIYAETDAQSSYAARNKGVRNASGEVIAFLDADMYVQEDWIETLVSTIERSNARYLGCRVELSMPANPTLAARFDHHSGFPVQEYIANQHFAPTCCLVVHREVFEQLGLFDPRLTSAGDKEFGERVFDAGVDMHFAEDVTVYHPTRNSLGELVRKDLRVGRGHCQLQRRYPDIFGTPGIPPRPSGVKRPDRAVPIRDRLPFGILSTFLTGIRGIGYYHEFLAGGRHISLGEAPPLEN